MHVGLFPGVEFLIAAALAFLLGMALAYGHRYSHCRGAVLVTTMSISSLLAVVGLAVVLVASRVN